jgi:hypothetical protein
MTNRINPWIRKYNYIEDYFYTVYDYYSRVYPAFPVTYYATDHNETIWDDEYLNAGTYEHRGVGELSGQKWKKINMLPVFSIDQITPTQESNEKGINYEDSMTTRIAFPSVYGLKPYEDDAVDLSFGLKNPDMNIKNMYSINKVDISHHGDYLQFYICNIKISNFSKTDIEKQISNHWLFYEHEKSILPLDNSQILLMLQERSIELSNDINNNFSSSGVFLNSKEV